MLSFKTARKYVRFTKAEKLNTVDAVAFEADVPDSVPIGDDIVVAFKVILSIELSEYAFFDCVSLQVTNISRVAHEVYIGVVAKVMQYNGK